jgi:hypothetical protein
VPSKKTAETDYLKQEQAAAKSRKNKGKKNRKKPEYHEAP